MARAIRNQQKTNPVYPLVNTQQLQDLHVLPQFSACCKLTGLFSDAWDHLFHVHIVNRITVHSFEKPPKSVLELGCGSGIWVIDAAKQWKACCSPAIQSSSNQFIFAQNTTFVGFDIDKLQPDLLRCGLTDLVTRIEWVHGNLWGSRMRVFQRGLTNNSLDLLPFLSESFDFVRIRCIGLGVPENKVCQGASVKQAADFLT